MDILDIPDFQCPKCKLDEHPKEKKRDDHDPGGDTDRAKDDERDKNIDPKDEDSGSDGTSPGIGSETMSSNSPNASGGTSGHVNSRCLSSAFLELLAKASADVIVADQANEKRGCVATRAKGVRGSEHVCRLLDEHIHQYLSSPIATKDPLTQTSRLSLVADVLAGLKHQGGSIRVQGKDGVWHAATDQVSRCLIAHLFWIRSRTTRQAPITVPLPTRPLVPRDKPHPPAEIQTVSRFLFVADDAPSAPCVDERLNYRNPEGLASNTAKSELSLLAGTAMAGASDSQFPIPLAVRGPIDNTSDDTPSPPFITGCMERRTSQNLEALTPNTANRELSLLADTAMASTPDSQFLKRSVVREPSGDTSDGSNGAIIYGCSSDVSFVKRGLSAMHVTSEESREGDASPSLASTPSSEITGVIEIEKCGDSQLRSVDFPICRKVPKDHPKRTMLAELIRENAPEYAIAPGSEGFYSQTNHRFLRSRHRFIADVISSLMSVEEAGRVMVCGRNEDWHNASSELRLRSLISIHILYGRSENEDTLSSKWHSLRNHILETSALTSFAETPVTASYTETLACHRRISS